MLLKMIVYARIWTLERPTPDVRHEPFELSFTFKISCIKTIFESSPFFAYNSFSTYKVPI